MVIAIVILSVLLLFALLQWFRSDIAGRTLFLYLKDKNIYLFQSTSLYRNDSDGEINLRPRCQVLRCFNPHSFTGMA